MQNSVLTFLRENSQRLRLERFGDLAGYSAVVATPRFKASSHLIFFLLPPGSQQAALVAKVPRIAGNYRQLEIETTNLINLQSIRPTGFDSVPKVVRLSNIGRDRGIWPDYAAGIRAPQPRILP